MIEKQAGCLTWAARFIVQKKIHKFGQWMLVEIFYHFHHFSIECNLGQCFKAFLQIYLSVFTHGWTQTLDLMMFQMFYNSSTTAGFDTGI